MELDFKALQPAEYLATFLVSPNPLLLFSVGSFVQEHGLRPDGRKADEARPVTVNTGSVSTADGSALVRMGGTLVTCGVKAELSNPPVESGDCGYLVCNVDLPPLCSPRVTPGPPTPRGQSLSQHLQDTLISCRCVDVKDLIVGQDNLCWVLYLDVVCLCDNGNVRDAVFFAATAALRNTSLPTVDVSSGSPEVSYQQRHPLSLPHLPLAISYSLFESHILLDPFHEEEELSSGHVSVVVLSHLKMGQPDCKLIGGLTKSGPPSLPSQKLIELVHRAQKRARLLADLLLTASGDKKT
ncbi:Exosome complex component RRP43 [Geodia barretti]|uniref:Ribosomal RNA-processing protein 43 n=1 Tax=Geodia barretti TaxID=519541 RepID=A0AA35XCV4_GEOBA|nr:Exosome complex component RRP43 [Geodia barretti]